ncbi:MAG TPA: trypsin-like peptidase domain-containing protein [Pirellulales bacterium]|nr:trypsin-like peptidase domain-containing protein [Pirellulales bacterium]
MQQRTACALGRHLCLVVALAGGLIATTPLRRASAEISETRRSPIVTAVERARSAIVNIHGEKLVDATDVRDSRSFDGKRRVNGMGTGVILDERGYVITNHHVVDGVKKIMVTTADRETYVARLISRDPATDLAIIKIDADHDFDMITIGTSSDLMPGETVIAVGNAYGYEHTVTRGIISALHRSVQVSDAQQYEDLIQTDASINPGNSGGPLLNIDGDMVGINVAVRAGAQGIGFAIPADKVLNVAADLLSTRKLDKTWHGLQAHTNDAGTVEVLSVDEQSPAAAIGLQSGDIITAIGGVTIGRALDVERAFLGRAAGDSVELSIRRKEQPTTKTLVLAGTPRAEKPSTDPTWDLLGLKLEQVPAKQFQQHRTHYRGGLTVIDVRPDSPAARQGIRRGDVLVGMHVWETISPENVTYILGRADFAQLDPLKFYILRGSETLYGHLTVSRRAGSETR